MLTCYELSTFVNEFSPQDLMPTIRTIPPWTPTSAAPPYLWKHCLLLRLPTSEGVYPSEQ
jgi:hypothetical protein